MWPRYGIARSGALVEHLKQPGIIRSPKVAEIIRVVDRRFFVPGEHPPYEDSPMTIGYNATISAPHMLATCLQLLEQHLQPGMHALDVGSGTEYLTTCFALMVGHKGHAAGVEHITELVAAAVENVKNSVAAPLLNQDSLTFHVGGIYTDGRIGWHHQFAPYDAIHVGASTAEIPKPLIEQWKPGGRMVIPVGNFCQDLQVVDKRKDGSVSVRMEASVRYVPLTNRGSQLRDC